MSRRLAALTGAVLLLLAPRAAAQPPGRFALRDGDRVVLLGNALVEHEQFHGHVETRLLRHFPKAKVTFRNMGWSGDTVRGDARTSGYQNPEGMGRLLREVRAQKPTVLFVGYGMNESFAGPAGLAGFVQGLGKLLDDLAPLKARVVLLSPSFHEDLGRPLPDPAGHNRDLEQYAAAVQKLAATRGLAFVDVFHPLVAAKKMNPGARFTTNGILLNSLGYTHVAAAVERQLGLPAAAWRVELDAAGKVVAADGARATADGPLRVRVEDARIPAPGHAPVVRVAGLPAGTYTLKCDGGELLTAPAAALARGVPLDHGPFAADAEKLRLAVVARNALFDRRWRPFNDHSRHWGFIGGDFKLYDDEIAAQEAVIDRLRQAPPHVIEIVRKEGAK
jgi:lysophospholipase L1-like esterase